MLSALIMIVYFLSDQEIDSTHEPNVESSHETTQYQDDLRELDEFPQLVEEVSSNHLEIQKIVKKQKTPKRKMQISEQRYHSRIFAKMYDMFPGMAFELIDECRNDFKLGERNGVTECWFNESANNQDPYDNNLLATYINYENTRITKYTTSYEGTEPYEIVFESPERIKSISLWVAGRQILFLFFKENRVVEIHNHEVEFDESFFEFTKRRVKILNDGKFLIESYLSELCSLSGDEKTCKAVNEVQTITYPEPIES